MRLYQKLGKIMTKFRQQYKQNLKSLSILDDVFINKLFSTENLNN